METIQKTKIARVRNDGRWHSRGSDWSTPQELFNSLNQEFNFTLDACASDWNTKCKFYFSEKENGLIQDWGKEIVFMNPPYGKVLENWMKKAYESSLKGAIVVCLVPASTDTNWWHSYALKGELRYLRGRPRFVTKEGSWQQTFSPSVIVVFKKGFEVRIPKEKVEDFMMKKEGVFLKRVVEECNVGDRRVLLGKEIANVLRAIYRQTILKTLEEIQKGGLNSSQD